MLDRHDKRRTHYPLKAFEKDFKALLAKLGKKGVASVTEHQFDSYFSFAGAALSEASTFWVNSGSEANFARKIGLLQNYMVRAGILLPLSQESLFGLPN